VTGSSGQVGHAASVAPSAAGWEVRPFDVAGGQDLRDEAAVRKAVTGCDVVIHAGAIPNDSRGNPVDIVATNLLGTWHILAAAEDSGVSRVIYLSSVQVFGCSEGEGRPVYWPVDDDHPLRAARPYGMSKRLAETMCEAWTARTGIPTVVLRPAHIMSEERFAWTKEEDLEDGAFVHIDDVTDAIVRSTAAPPDGHVRLTLCGPGPFDSSAAQRVLGWTATRFWPSAG
jgi:UDP-glucose 4-epimerase